MKSELRIPTTTKLEDLTELAELGRNAEVIFHDLSNHLTALTLSMDNLRACLVRDGEKLLEYSKRSDQTREHMEYVAGLLKSHLSKTTLSHFSPVEEIRKILKTFELKALENQISVNLITKTSRLLFGNKHVFAHIVTNLISNAIESFGADCQAEKPRPEQQRNIELRIAAHDQATILTIKDTGCGIPQVVQKKVFAEKFTTKKTGHGIGLFAIKKFVEEEFSGRITFKSSGHGTTFTIRLPGLKRS